MIRNEILVTIRSYLNSFIQDEDRSLLLAGKIEVLLDENFPNDEDIQNAVTSFALYRPGGGDFLYNEEHMVEICKALINEIQRYESRFCTAN